MRLRRPIVAVATALALLAPAPAYADGSAAVAINTKDGFDIFRLAFSIRRAAGDVVDTSNAAAAVASCTDCQTIALAIQVVLVTGDPEVVTPTNLALALNVECTLCDTLASAYQFVLSTGGAVHFTAEGQQRLVEIRKALLALRDSGLTGAQIQAEVAELMTELRDVLATELVPAGNSGLTGAPDDPGASASPSAPASASESPAATPDPSASASESPEPSTSPSADPSATPTPKATP